MKNMQDTEKKIEKTDYDIYKTIQEKLLSEYEDKAKKNYIMNLSYEIITDVPSIM